MADRDYSKEKGKFIRITKVYPKALSMFTDTDAQKEGFKDLTYFIDYLKKYNGEGFEDWNKDREVWDRKVVWIHEFELVSRDP